MPSTGIYQRYPAMCLQQPFKVAACGPDNLNTWRRLMTASYFFPCLNVTPAFDDEVIRCGEFAVHRRLWSVTMFDLATLGSRHKVNLPWSLLETFLKHAHCEIEVQAANEDSARTVGTAIQGMLLLKGITPFLTPFIATHSMNDYAGINNRDSTRGLEDMPEGLRTGITSAETCVEVWPFAPTFHCIAISGERQLTAEVFHRAATDLDKWMRLEDRHQHLRAARFALQMAPVIPDLPSSLLHLWQGIEALFPDVSSEVSFRTSLLVGQLASPLRPVAETYRTARRSYGHRSKAAHGSVKGLQQDHWKTAWDLLRLSLNAVLQRGNLPTEGELIDELLGAPAGKRS